jgi:hypothetical protein
MVNRPGDPKGLSVLPETQHLARTRRKSERAQASVVGCKAICDWLRAERIPGSFGEQIICGAQRQLAIEEEHNWLPSKVPPPGMTTAELIRRSRPVERKKDEIFHIAPFVQWLVLWSFYSMPDSLVRYRALEMALEKQFKR